MKVHELIEALEELNGDSDIVLDVQNKYNFVFNIEIERGANRDRCGYPSRDGVDYDKTIYRLTT